MRKSLIGAPIALLLLSVILVGCPRFDVAPTVLKFTVDENQKVLQVKNMCLLRELTFDVASSDTWLTVDHPQVTVAAGQFVNLNVMVSYAKASFSAATLTVTASDGDKVLGDAVEVPVSTGAAEYFTQPFEDGLAGKMVVFNLADQPSFYKTDIADLPAGSNANMRVAPSGLTLDDYQPLPSLLYQDPIPVKPLDGQKVSLYGQAFDTFWVGSDGRVTFHDPAVTEASLKDDASLFERYFATPAVSALFAQFGTGGAIHAVQLEDRIVIIYDSVPQLDGDQTSANSFQIELFFDQGAAKAAGPQSIAMAWFSVDADIDALVGLSEGGIGGGPIHNDADGDGVPDDFTIVGNLATNLRQNSTWTDDLLIPGPDQGKELTLTVDVTPLGAGTVTIEPDEESYDLYDMVVLSAQANAGWEFAGWLGDVDDPEAMVTSVLMEMDQEITATFVEYTTKSLKVSLDF